MALGAGTFTAQNKILPGAYMNFVSTRNITDDFGKRGVVALVYPIPLGGDGVVRITASQFKDSAQELLGYHRNHEKLKPLYDLFRGAEIAYIYNTNSLHPAAKNEFATAKAKGPEGERISISIIQDPEGPNTWAVVTLLDEEIVDRQIVSDAKRLKENAYVTFNVEVLRSVAKEPLKWAGSEFESKQVKANHVTALEALEGYSFNTLVCTSNDPETTRYYIEYTKEMRDEYGRKFQLVAYQAKADYEGVINVETSVKGADEIKHSLVYWVGGMSAGCAVNASLLNKVYDGQFEPILESKQSKLEEFLQTGKFALHSVNGEPRVLGDINSLTTFKRGKGEVFSKNQSIRVCDQIANDIAKIFNEHYLGVCPNDAPGRAALWSEIVDHHQYMQKIRAIESFEDTDVVVKQGEAKDSVVVEDAITVINSMAKLYMTVTVG